MEIRFAKLVETNRRLLQQISINVYKLLLISKYLYLKIK